MADCDAFLPSSMDKTDLLLDTEFCAALGVFPESGCCVRHPHVTIIAKDERSEHIVSTCQECESEFLSGGLRKRESFAVAIFQMQKRRNDEHGWIQFKKNWDHGTRISMLSAATKDSESDLHIESQADDRPRRLDSYIPSSILQRPDKIQVAWKEYTWQVILRTTQVQEWAMAEKDKEIEILKAKLVSFSAVSRNDSNTELLSTAALSALSATEEGESLYGDNPTYIQPIVEEAPPKLPHRQSSSRFAPINGARPSVAESPAESNELLAENAPRPPQRQISNDLYELEHSTTNEDEEGSESDDDPELYRKSMGISANSNRGSGRMNVRASKFQARVPPTLPLRQASNEGLMRTSQASYAARNSNISQLSELSSPSMYSGSMDSFALHESAPNLDYNGSFAVTGLENMHSYRSSRTRMSSLPSSEFKSLDTILSDSNASDHRLSNTSSTARLEDITPLSGNLRKSIPSLPEHAVVTGEEISFIPPVMEEPPPPPPTREDSMPFSAIRELQLNGSSHQDIRFDASQPDIKLEQPPNQDITFDASQDIKFDASQDIRFDASQDIRFDASQSNLPADRVFRRASIQEMQFSDKDKLLQEASLAFSSPQYVSKKIIKSLDYRKVSKPAPIQLATSVDLGRTERSEISFDPQPNTRPASADDIFLKRPPNDLKPPPLAAEKLETPPRERKPMKLGEFLEKNKNGNDSDEEPEMAEFGDLPVSAGFLRIEGGGGSPVSCVTMLTTDPMSVMGGSVEDDEDLEPNIGLSEGGPRRLLPMEEGFHSDEETSSSEESNQKPAAVAPRETIQVVDQIVNDQYGDSGLYTGSVTADGRIPHGRGVMMYENEREYNGDWSDGRWHGQGEWVNPNGDRYNGTFVFDSRHGEGTYSWRNGNTYKGEFFEDKREGKGVFTFANGNVYEGDFINGVFEGEGKYTFGNGFYRGSWKGGKYHGIGFLQFNDGSSYSGTFVEGVAHGEGKEISADGTVTTGFWDQGVAPEKR